MLPKLFLLICFLALALQASAGTLLVPADTVSGKIPNKKVALYSAGIGAVYVGGLVVLSQAWYDKNTQTSFHFFNDNAEWKQMDKAGHFWGAFQESKGGVDALKKTGLSEKQAIWLGSLTGILLQTPIELLDGYQESYGASPGDLIANTAGSAAVLAQQLAWREIRIQPKFSFHKTRYAALRPDVLGNSLAERALKDYNGQTYWLSVDVAKFLPEERKYPKWLNLAVGYGAEEMVYNDPDANSQIGIEKFGTPLKPYRQYYLTVDLNLRAIKTRSKVLKTAFYILDIFHLPAPALEYNNRKKLRFHGLYY
ncbi:DUF2279 domain-containing protein [Adhaeribacter sp. BT258]|uniref:DUF2279 domain-containing protein n=1 Tax=Adhaeribacter terrigena TaxID=2793070 RepID=A0ABS1C357_9BACT|nr:DUF2279 domain-containing protein [Adhaeribacter terrigena]